MFTELSRALAHFEAKLNIINNISTIALDNQCFAWLARAKFLANIENYLDGFMSDENAVQWASQTFPNQWRELCSTFRRMGRLASEIDARGKNCTSSWVPSFICGASSQRGALAEKEYIALEKSAITRLEPIIQAYTDVCQIQHGQSFHSLATHATSGVAQLMDKLDLEFEAGKVGKLLTRS